MYPVLLLPTSTNKQVHKQFGYQDDPRIGSFLDAFCDKIVICTSLWTVLLLTDYSRIMDSFSGLMYLGICCTIIVYEVILGIVRVQDYYGSTNVSNNNNQQIDVWEMKI